MEKIIENVVTGRRQLNILEIDDATHGFLIGSKLGDGCYVKKTANHNTYLQFKHAQNQLDYLNWKFNFLKSKGFLKTNKKIKEVKLINCYPNAQKQYQFSTKSFKELNYYKELSYVDTLSQLNEMALAIWILDDGSINVATGWTCKITFPNKTLEEKRAIIDILSEKFGLSCYIYNHKTNPIKDTVNIRSESADLVKSIIKQNIPNIETVRRKLHEN